MNFPESWKTLSWSGENALVNLFSMLFFLFRNSESHRISSVTGLALWSSQQLQKKAIQAQQWPQYWLFLGLKSSRRAWAATDVSEEWCSMTARCPEGRTELILLFSNCLDVQGFFISLKGQKGTCKEMKRDNQRHRMNLAWGERVNRVAFFSSKRDVRQERW